MFVLIYSTEDASVLKNAEIVLKTSDYYNSIINHFPIKLTTVDVAFKNPVCFITENNIILNNETRNCSPCFADVESPGCFECRPRRKVVLEPVLLHLGFAVNSLF